MAISLDSFNSAYDPGTGGVPLQGDSASGQLPLVTPRADFDDPALHDNPPPDYYRPHAELVGPMVGPLVGQVINIRI